MSGVCPVCLGTVADSQARFCTHCGHPLEAQQFEATTIPEIDRNVLLGAVQPGPPSIREAMFAETPTTLPPWFGEGTQAPDTVPDLNARAIANDVLTTAPVEGLRAMREYATTLRTPASNAHPNADQPTQPVDRYQGPVPSYLAETIGPPLEQERVADPWVVDAAPTTTKRPLDAAAAAEDAKSIFEPLAAALAPELEPELEPAPEPEPLAAPTIAVELASIGAGAPRGQFVPGSSVIPTTPFAASTLPSEEPKPDTEMGTTFVATGLPLYSPHAPQRLAQPAAPPAQRAGHSRGEPASALGPAPEPAACWQCGIPISLTAAYYQVAGRPWCATCAAPYLPSRARSARRFALLLAKLVAFFGAIAAPLLLLRVFRLVSAVCVGLILFWLLFYRTRPRAEIRRVDPVQSR